MREKGTRRGTMIKFIFSCLLFGCIVRAEVQVGRVSSKIDVVRHCDFDEARTNYTAADLLQCIDKLAADLVDLNSVELRDGKGHWDGSTGRQISFVDALSSVFGSGQRPLQSSPLPAYSTSDYQQLDRPAGFQLNILNTLSTILRRDHYKCVQRILCEIASGKLPGRSLRLDSLARSVFTNWLTRIDVGASPLLIFGRAMILGYGNRENPQACFQAYPKCPTDMHGLIHYLNNYNGGFFRLFSKIRGNKHGASDEAAGQRVDEGSKVEVRERITSGSFKNIWNERFQNIVQFPVRKYQEYFKNDSPVLHESKTENQVVFPDDEGESENEAGINDVENEAAKVEANLWQENNVAFFPKDRDRRFSRFRFPSPATSSKFHK